MPSVKGNACLYCLNCTKFGPLILRKITTITATRCQILRLKCTKFDFGLGSAPDPAGGAYSIPPDPVAGFKGKRQGNGKDGEKEGREMGKEGRGGREGRVREGMEEGRGRGDRGNMRDGTGHGMRRRGKGKKGGKGRRGATAPKRQFLAPPLATTAR